MTIEFTDEQVEQLYNKGFTDEDLQYTINEGRQNGLSDSEIQSNILKAIGGEIQPTQPEKQKGIDLTPSGLLKNMLNSESAIRQTAPALLPALATGNFGAAKEIYIKAKDSVARDRKPQPIQDAIVDLAGYSLIPASRAAGGLGFASNVARFGTLPGLLEGMKNNNALGGALLGTGLGAGVQKVAPIVMNKVGQGVENIAKNSNVQKNIAKTIRFLTSVPEKYSKRAIEKEIQGQSILNNKFDADTAYRPIEQKLRAAKNSLPDATDYGNKYYDLGQKAVQGMENLKEKANAGIEEALEKLNDREIKNGNIQNAVDSVIKSFGKGGVYNRAKARAKNVVNFLDENLFNKEGLTLRDLHRIKEDLYDLGYAEAGAKNGVGAQVARGVANQINNYLRKTAPEYAKPNDVYRLLEETTRGLEGESTIGNKISKIGSSDSAKSGLDKRLKAVDDLLPDEYKFYNEAKNVINSEDETNNIISTIGKQYERNPKLLGNRTDETFEMALNDLQNRSGINFMDELDDIRAQDALNKLMPGQGGGSGSEEGFFNNYVRPALQALPKSAIATLLGNAVGGPLGAGAGLAAVSPKIIGQGAIKAIGKLAKTGEAAQGLRPLAQRLLAPLAARSAAPLQYGGISYTEEN